MKELKICDPLYGYIYFDKQEKSIIENLLFQRLRSIQQLGFSQYAFPSAIGNRFTHSLGVSHLAGVAFDSIFSKEPNLLKDSKKQIFRKVVRLAALLHDIGHGPISHSSECLMPKLEELNLGSYLKKTNRVVACHEDYSVKIILETEISDLIKAEGINPLWVTQLIHKDASADDDFFTEQGVGYFPLLKQIISSEVDVDRMDYLYRDSMHCGVKYGLIDFAWLLSHFGLYQFENKVFLSLASESLYTIESFLLGRQHMRAIVYFHHKSVIYNEMLKKYAESSHLRLPVDIEGYASFNDAHLMNEIKKDSSKNEWADSIANQKPFVRLYEYNHIGEPKTDEKDKFNKVKKDLEKGSIPYIEINSNKNAIKPSKDISKNFPVYLKNNLLKTDTTLFDKPHLLNISKRQIDRIYVRSQDINSAQKFIF